MTFGDWFCLICALVCVLILLRVWLEGKKVRRFVEQSDLQRMYEPIKLAPLTPCTKEQFEALRWERVTDQTQTEQKGLDDQPTIGA